MPGESLREQLQSTYDDLVAREAASAPPEVVTPEPDAGAVTPPAEAADAEQGDTQVPERPRNDKGQFAPKTDNEGQASAPEGDGKAKPQSETAKPANEEPQSEAIRVPPSLPAAVKAKFASLDPDVQKAFSGLEDSVQKAKAEWGKKGERLNRFDEVLAPRREQLAIRGVDEVQAIQLLFAAQDLLDRDPVAGIRELARSYGVNLAQFGGQTSLTNQGQGAQPAPAQVPGSAEALTPIMRQLQTLEQRLVAIDQRSEAEKLADAQRQVNEFATRPENLYWENVKFDVAQRLQANPNLTLADAYESAIWASPEIRPLLLQAQAQAPAPVTQQPDPGAAQRLAEAAARKKAEDARKAAGSVTGAPQGGAVAPAPGSTGNLRADLEAAWKASQGV
jgi:hypothetical protein